MRPRVARGIAASTWLATGGRSAAAEGASGRAMGSSRAIRCAGEGACALVRAWGRTERAGGELPEQEGLENRGRFAGLGGLEHGAGGEGGDRLSRGPRPVGQRVAAVGAEQAAAEAAEAEGLGEFFGARILGAVDRHRTAERVEGGGLERVRVAGRPPVGFQRECITGEGARAAVEERAGLLELLEPAKQPPPQIREELEGDRHGRLALGRPPRAGRPGARGSRRPSGHADGTQCGAEGRAVVEGWTRVSATDTRVREWISAVSGAFLRWRRWRPSSTSSARAPSGRTSPCSRGGACSRARRGTRGRDADGRARTTALACRVPQSPRLPATWAAGFAGHGEVGGREDGKRKTVWVWVEAGWTKGVEKHRGLRVRAFPTRRAAPSRS